MHEQPKLQVPRVVAIKAKDIEMLAQVDLVKYLLLRRQYFEDEKKLQEKHDFMMDAL